MKAPDKIYVGIQDLGSGYATDVSFTPEEGHSEYIRKDVILKLLQKRNKEIRGAAHCAFRSYELQEVYWRINEL